MQGEECQFFIHLKLEFTSSLGIFSNGTGADGQLLRDLLKAADGIDWLHDSLGQLEA